MNYQLYCIRMRPGMYIGGLGTPGLLHLVDELIHFGLAEFHDGHPQTLHVHIHGDGSLTVADDRHGVPMENYPGTEMTTLEWVMRNCTGRTIHEGQRSYSTSCHGSSVRAVTALSDWLEVEVRWNGRVYCQRYERGEPISDVTDMGPAETQTGTRITFHPDPEIFGQASFDTPRLLARLRELALLNKGLTIQFVDERTGRAQDHCFSGGITGLVARLHQGVQPLHIPIQAKRSIDGVQAEFAMVFLPKSIEKIRCYGNNAHNPRGGAHLSGFRAGLTRAFSRYGAERGLLSDELGLKNDDFRHGLAAVINVKVAEPQFESQSKLRLHNPEVNEVVAQVVRDALERFLNENPQIAQRIIRREVG